MRRKGVVASIRSRKAGLSKLVAGHVGSDHPGRDGVDPDAFGADFGCEAFGEALDRALGRGVGASPGSPPSRAAIDERLTIAPPLPPWLVESRSTASLQARMVAITLSAKSRVSSSRPARRPGRSRPNAGIVDKAGERSERLRRMIEQAVEAEPDRRRRPGTPAPAARLHDPSHRRLGRLGVGRVIDGDRIAVGREAAANRRADPREPPVTMMRPEGMARTRSDAGC